MVAIARTVLVAAVLSYEHLMLSRDVQFTNTIDGS